MDCGRTTLRCTPWAWLITNTMKVEIIQLVLGPTTTRFRCKRQCPRLMSAFPLEIVLSTNGSPMTLRARPVDQRAYVNLDAVFRNDSDCVQTHSYHSYVDLDIDTNSGLIGPSIVYAKGQMNSTMANYREIPLLYMIYDEYTSFLSGENAKIFNNPDGSPEYGGLDTTSLWTGNYSIWHPQLVNLKASGRLGKAPSFRESSIR